MKRIVGERRGADPAHTVNFVESVRSRKTPNADIEIGHRGTSIALLGNIAMKTGKKLHWDAKTELQKRA